MALCPGVTETNFFEASGMDHPPMRVSQTPEEVVETALRALNRKKSTVSNGAPVAVASDVKMVMDAKPSAAPTRVSVANARSRAGARVTLTAG